MSNRNRALAFVMSTTASSAHPIQENMSPRLLNHRMELMFFRILGSLTPSLYKTQLIRTNVTL